MDTVSVNGVEDSEEFDEASNLTTTYCTLLTEDQFEDQSVTETEKALEDLMGYLDTHTDEFTQLLKKKKRQDMENGGIFSFMKVKMLDMIHGENSPVLQVSEKERHKKLVEMKTNMQKAFEISMETKGRRCSKRLLDKRQRRGMTDCTTPSRLAVPPAPPAPPSAMPPPPPPPPPGVMTTPKLKLQSRRPFTPIENRMNSINVNTPESMKKSKCLDPNDSLGSMPVLDCSLSSLHQELLSSNPWKRLKCVTENKSPGGTPKVAKKSLQLGGTPKEPLYQALFNNIQEKFKNVRTPSPSGALYNNVTSPASVLSPVEFTP